MGLPGMSLAFFMPSWNMRSSTCAFLPWAFSSSWKRSARRAAAPLSEASASSRPTPDLGLGAGSWAITASSAGSMVSRPSQQGHVTVKVAMAPRVAENPSAAEAAQLGVEAGQDGLEECVLHQSRDRGEGARVRVVESAGELDAGRHLLARAVLQDLGHPAHHRLVGLVQRALSLVLLRVVHRHVLEERLHVAVHLAITRTELAVERKLARGDVELAVGAQQVVHGGEVGVVDLQRQIEVWPRTFGEDLEIRARGPRAHEFAPNLGRRGLAGLQAAEVREARGGVREEDPIVGGLGLVHVAEVALDDLELVDAELQPGLLG